MENPNTQINAEKTHIEDRMQRRMLDSLTRRIRKHIWNQKKIH